MLRRMSKQKYFTSANQNVSEFVLLKSLRSVHNVNISILKSVCSKAAWRVNIIKPTMILPVAATSLLRKDQASDSESSD